jgi:hypothetical protein
MIIYPTLWVVCLSLTNQSGEVLDYDYFHSTLLDSIGNRIPSKDSRKGELYGIILRFYTTPKRCSINPPILLSRG